MTSQRALFTASRTQTLTYLLAVCPFSIAFLVYINSSISFVVTELIGLHDGEGDAVGTLGFADELLALAACPLWGVLSDRIGVRHVCVAGYSIIAVALVVLVQAKNVYPQLLLGRLLFSIGGSAVSTMVTAVLPTVTGSSSEQEPSETANTRNSSSRGALPQAQSDGEVNTPSSRLAGFVGMCAGCGALVSLVIFLPLPAQFQKLGLLPSEAIQYSYYVVAVVALLVSIWCLFGLRNLPGEEKKAWNSLWSTPDEEDDQPCAVGGKSRLPYLDQFGAAVVLGFRHSDILIGYVGGFVARASSVGISLFIPLFVNHYYRVLGYCHGSHNEGLALSAGDIKHSCPDAYKLASILTGVSQLVALIAAPIFGYLSDKSRRRHIPLLFACLAGVVGYTTFPLLPTPKFSGEGGNPTVFVIMSLIGISQIGAIVCSLAVLSNGILNAKLNQDIPKQAIDAESESHAESDVFPPISEADRGADRQPLLARHENNHRHRQLSHLKGSIAGVYSLFGGAGILLLTKLGGLLFDVLSSGAPFYIMAGFNGALLLAGVIGCLLSRKRYPSEIS
ncbi:MFS general substrate transporter [Aspergillus alliaceus]|uniref:MFS general substrate transporter n=1 Tax=Petromyces alliaceus TaxID=209559 RepID=A0A5N6GB38_PETAA|nr:MFS general substrate transporter [Aspergillus alliaceus]KAB8238469.1 MFS general substrate transporter [Aspergillus alliaceus]KAE8392260.1 MFS general substrate transporter [Aspergillus alliaceus]